MEKKVCTDIREKFSDYIDELLTETEMADLEMHMKKCPACRKDLESFNKTIQALRNLPRYTAHPNIIVKIKDRIEKNKSWWQRLNPKVMKGTFGAITAVILCVFGLQLYNGTNVTDIFMVKETVKSSRENEAAKSDSTLKSEVQQKKRKIFIEKAQPAQAAKAEEKRVENKNAVDKVQIAGEFADGKTDAAEQLGQSSQPLEKELKLGYTAKDLSQAIGKGENIKSNNTSDMDKAAVKDDIEIKKAIALKPASSPSVTKWSSLEGTYEQKGLSCQNSTAENIVIKDEKALETLWIKCFSELTKPVIDFKNEMLIVILLGEQNETPKDINLKEIINEKEKIKIRYSLTTILNTDTSGKKLSPYCIKAVKKSSLVVEFIKE